MKRNKFFLLTAVVLISTAVSGQAYSDSLRSYLEMAARNNPSVQQKWSEYKAALQKVPQVGSLSDPDLTMGFFLSPMELPGGNQVADLQLMQMFPWFGVIKNAKDEMGLMAKASYSAVEEVKLKVFYDVQSSWFNLYRNREQVRITEEKLELLRQLESLATVRYAAGSVLTDIYALQLEENELSNTIASLNDQYQSLLYRFNKLLNRSVETPVVLPNSAYIDGFEPPSDSALKNNPMLTMLQYERESLEARQKMTDRMGYPMVGVGLKYTIMAKNPASTSMMNGRDMLMPMVSVSLPIYRKKYKAIQEETEWRKTASDQNYEAKRNLLQADFQDAVFNFRDAQRRIQLYENQIKLTDKKYQLELNRFAASASALAELKRISRQQLDYALKEMNVRVDLLIVQAKMRQLTAQH